VLQDWGDISCDSCKWRIFENKKNTKPKKKLGIHDETQEIKELIINSGYPDKKLYDKANNLDSVIQLLLKLKQFTL
jgi:hypothetical protein